MTAAKPLFSSQRMEYETPREGSTIGRYVARRLHKTALLKPVADLLKQDSARALAQIAIYAAAASTSFGPALYQPDGDPAGKVLETIDPETDARVMVTCEGNLRFSYRIEMKHVGVLVGAETITGTTVGWRGLEMPAPTTFKFEAEQSDYRAEMIGVITSELGPGLGRWKIRGYGSLDLSDSVGNRGKLTLDRSGIIVVSISTADGHSIALKARLV
ncbi:MAG: hypothetical protein HZB51_13035 [Chloroflexi bacterium]|nr:hypothetical protein [Chloroflexota bacterium]